MKLSNMNFKLRIICSRKEKIGNFGRELEVIKKVTTQKVVELKNTITDIKYSNYGFRKRLELKRELINLKLA